VLFGRCCYLQRAKASCQRANGGSIADCRASDQLWPSTSINIFCNLQSKSAESVFQQIEKEKAKSGILASSFFSSR
jgi:hypothetical protein